MVVFSSHLSKTPSKLKMTHLLWDIPGSWVVYTGWRIRTCSSTLSDHKPGMDLPPHTLITVHLEKGFHWPAVVSNHRIVEIFRTSCRLTHTLRL